PELRELLGREDLRQLAQRITARFHLTPLSVSESEEYLRHRFAAAGGQRFPFSKLAVRRIHVHSQGVPRLINIVAERALLAGYAKGVESIGERWVDLAAKEALAPPLSRLPKPRLAVVLFAVLTIALVAVLLWPKPLPLPPPPQIRPELLAALQVPYLDNEPFIDRSVAAGASPLPAWQRLLTLWTVRSDVVDSSTASQCAPVLAPGLYCLRSRGTLDKLQVLGRPALLRLRAANHESWAVLLGSDARTVRLWLGEGQVETARVILERHWTGEFAVIWRGPDFLGRMPRPGARGPAVDWVHDRLHSGNNNVAAGPALMDAALIEAVRRFQAESGLLADGVVGPETLLALGAIDPGPRLHRSLE
ncbi:MAG TPA: peptidoglycan-binding protein, partial [Arenimonas sp.]|nr:peptidoglycan-binding protein [Arenimonas sp.]